MSKLSPETEQRIDDSKVQVLEEKRYILCKYLNALRHLIYLRTANILSNEDCEEIKSQPTQETKNNKLIDLIISKGPRGFDELCASLLKDKTQVDVLLRPLNISFEEKRAAVMRQRALMLELE